MTLFYPLLLKIFLKEYVFVITQKNFHILDSLCGIKECLN